jgi:hypothetical protein
MTAGTNLLTGIVEDLGAGVVGDFVNQVFHRGWPE